MDRLLRDLPGKAVDPPADLRGRIMAALPEPVEQAGALGWGFGRWAALAGGLAACVFAVVLALRGAVPKPAGPEKAPPANVAVAPRPALPPAGAPAVRERAVAPQGAGARPSTAVAAAAPVKVIREVKIYFYYPAARQVAVTGDFNGWDPRGVPLRPAGKLGLWTAKLRLPPGAYSYNFIVDGDTLVPDPNAPAEAPDGYGGTNSIMLVKKGDKRT